MKVRMKVSLTGTHDGQDWPAPGEVVDVADNVAADLIANGYAEADERPAAKRAGQKVEKATAPEPEKRA